MKLAQPSPQQAATIVQAMFAVVSAEGRIAPLPIERESIDAAQRHLLFQDPPLTGVPGRLPDDLASVIDTAALRLQAVRILALLPTIDRRILPEKVQVVQDAAARLGVHEYGLDMLRHAANGRFKRIAFGLMQRFVANNWSPAGRARLRDYVSFVWWMVPQLHGPNTARRNRELLARYQALGQLPPGTFGNAVHRFFTSNAIPMPGDAKSVPWAMHEVYHVLSEYSVGLPAELLLTGFIGGTQDDTCLDQMLFGLMVYHCGRQIIGGFVTEGVLRPDEFFRAIARGAQINIDVMARDWDLFAVAAMPLPDLRAMYSLPAFSAHERRTLATHNGLLAGPGYSLSEPVRVREAAE
ncbi:MAG: hypothetical protein P4L71_00045 [Acetobacteraceae bacterium]|nr:hypothetical protein [Acetobacteraceae bacterium]